MCGCVRSNYLLGWFGLDFISITVSVFDVISLPKYGGSAGGLGKLKVFRVIRVLRLIKLVRLFRASRVLKR